MKISKAINSIALMIVCAVFGMAQSKGVFIDRANRFNITLSERWRSVNYTDAVGRERTEFVLGQRNDGLLRISRDRLGGRTLARVVDKELEDLRSYDGKYLLADREPFEGDSLRGIRIAFYYVEGSRQAAGTYYFLEETDEVWILRFTGRVGLLDVSRDTTDQIARSFRPK